VAAPATAAEGSAEEGREAFLIGQAFSSTEDSEPDALQRNRWLRSQGLAYRERLALAYQEHLLDPGGEEV
jgi:hypothetical protein